MWMCSCGQCNKEEHIYCTNCGKKKLVAVKLPPAMNIIPWLIATLPVVLAIVAIVFLWPDDVVTFVGYAISGLVFVDREILKLRGFHLKKWRFLGWWFPGLYLFYRAKETNKKYAAAIVRCSVVGAWIILYVISLYIS